MERDIVKMVESRAKKYGKRDVFKYKNARTGVYDCISWVDFWEQSKKVTKSLFARGLHKGYNIGIMSENLYQWTITDIGILAAQNIVVPIYSNSVNEQVKFIIEQTEMKLLFVGNETHLDVALWALKNTSFLEKVVVFKKGKKLMDSRCVYWDDFLLDGERVSESDLEKSIEGIHSQDLATILFTSGTTGDPKGVMLGHDNFTQCFSIHDKRLSIDESDISLSFLPISHIFERSWVYYMLYRGAKVIYLENPRDVIDEIKVIRPTVMCTVPRFFEKTYNGIHTEMANWPAYKQKLFNWAISVGEKVSDFKSKNEPIPKQLGFKYSIANKLVFKKLQYLFGGNIRSLPCSGAAISNHHLKFFHAAGIFVNYGYGTTETTATVSCFRNDIYDLNTCGTIMPEVEVKLSEINEILVKGKTLFKGYYKNPEATASAIVDGWYKTGDKGYLSENGDLVMTDRINDIFKTSVGKFISPQKIELALLKDSFIEQVVVLGDNKKYLSALIVPSFEKFRAVWKIEGIDDHSDEGLTKHPRIMSFMQNRIERCQRDHASHEKVVKFTLLSEPFTIQNNSLTNTLKVRRNLIAEKYRNQIEEMYLSS